MHDTRIPQLDEVALASGRVQLALPTGGWQADLDIDKIALDEANLH